MQNNKEPMNVQMIAKTVATGAQLLAAITSAFILSTIIFSQMPGHWPDWLVYLLTITMVAGVIAIIELFPRSLLPSTFDQLFLDEKNMYSWSFALFTLLICLSLQSVSILTSYHSRDLIAEAIVKDPELVNSSSFLLTHDSLLRATRKRFNDRIDILELNEEKRLKTAQNEKIELVQAAIASKGKEMKRLYEKGNSWAANQLRMTLNQANSLGQSLIDLEKHKISTLKAERDSTLKALEVSSNEKLVFFESSNKSKLDTYKKKTGRYQSYAAWIGIGGSIVFLIMTLFLALHRRVTGLKLQTKQTAPPLLHAIFGVIHGMINILSRSVYTLAEKEEMVSVTYGSRRGEVNSVSTEPQRASGGWQITCRNCGKVALKQRKTAKYCSVECHDEWHTKQGTDIAGIKKAKSRKTRLQV